MASGRFKYTRVRVQKHDEAEATGSPRVNVRFTPKAVIPPSAHAQREVIEHTLRESRASAHGDAQAGANPAGV